MSALGCWQQLTFGAIEVKGHYRHTGTSGQIGAEFIPSILVRGIAEQTSGLSRTWEDERYQADWHTLRVIVD